MPRPRDSKKSALYDAEQTAFGQHGRWAAEFTLAEAQAWLDKFMAQRWFKQRWQVGKVEVLAGRGLRGTAYYRAMTLGVNARNRTVILHELAHILVDREPGVHAHHGPEFAATFLLLVRHEFGAETANRLRAEYVKRRVRHQWSEVRREARYEVPTQAEEREKRAAKAKVPPSLRERQEAAEVLREAVSAGHFGPAGSKPRTHALATARALEKP